jgi:hypothetical protein
MDGILAGQMSSKSEDATLFADLFFYEGSTGYGETYATDGKGGIWMVGQQGGFPLNSVVFAGHFGCIGNYQEWTNLLFFNRTANTGTIYAFGFTEDSQSNVLCKPVETIRPQAPEPIQSARPELIDVRSFAIPSFPADPGVLSPPETSGWWMVMMNTLVTTRSILSIASSIMVALRIYFSTIAKPAPSSFT